MSAPNAPPPMYYGWKVVWAAFVLAAFGWGVGFYGPPVYLQAVRDARGFTLPLASAAVTTHFLVGAAVVANLPALYGRFGIAAVTKAGAVALGAGVCGWALAREPWHLFAATLASGAGWVAMGAAAVNAIVSPWFATQRPAALATAYNGASIGGVVFSPLWVAGIGWIGFGPAAAAVGVVMVVAVWMLADHMFGRTPQQLGLVPDGGAASAAPAAVTWPEARPLPGRALWGDRRFVTLAAGMALGLFAQIGLIAHLFSLLVPALGHGRAGLAMALATAAAIAGRTLVGWLMPPGADRRVVAAASYAVQIAGSLALVAAAGSNVALIVAGVVLFGLGIGNATSLPPLIAQVEFVKDDVARTVALIVAIGQATYAFAPAVFGLVRELSAAVWPAPAGADPLLFAVATLVQGVAIGCFLTGRSEIRMR